MPEGTDLFDMAAADALEPIKHVSTGGHYRAYWLGTGSFSHATTSQLRNKSR